MLPEDYDSQLFAEFGLFFGKNLASFYQIVDAFSLVCGFHGTKQKQLLVRRDLVFFSNGLLVSWLEQICIDGIRDAGNRLMANQFAALCHIAQPLATRHKMYLTSLKHFHLSLECMVGKVFLASFE